MPEGYFSCADYSFRLKEKMGARQQTRPGECDWMATRVLYFPEPSVITKGRHGCLTKARGCWGRARKVARKVYVMRPNSLIFLFLTLFSVGSLFLFPTSVFYLFPPFFCGQHSLIFLFLTLLIVGSLLLSFLIFIFFPPAASLLKLVKCCIFYTMS